MAEESRSLNGIRVGSVEDEKQIELNLYFYWNEILSTISAMIDCNNKGDIENWFEYVVVLRQQSINLDEYRKLINEKLKGT